MKFVISSIFIFLILASSSFSQVTGLSGWNICLDPGHSRTENMGIYGYSEAERNVRVGLRLREFLLNTTDIDTVYITRTNDQQSVSLSQRTDYANSVGAAWFHSIHSNAGAPNRNNVLLLWGQYANGSEKIPNGGKAMSDIMVNILSRVMRIPSVGSWGDHTFYGGSPSYRPSPYLWVNYYTSMPSELSESGYHTNPRQNQLFMNTDWKKFEAWAFYWSILKFYEIQRPFVGTCVGIISDIETSIPINGATVSLGGQKYTTDTFESLFQNYTTDPDLLHNGFYYIENLPDDSLQMIVEAPGYYNDTSYVSIMDTFFTFKDVKLISQKSPYIVETTPAQGDTNYPAWEDLSLEFSRPMNTASVESNLKIVPEIVATFHWASTHTTLYIRSDSIKYETNYTITISGTATDQYGHLLDGNADGTGGDDFILSFKTGPKDILPPTISSIYPPQTSRDIETLPIINITYNKQINPASVTPDIFKLERFSNQTNVPYKVEHYVVNDQSSFCLFPNEKLFNKETYITRVAAGLYDIFGNVITSNNSFSFRTAEYNESITEIDNFESNTTNNWWVPQSSGSTTGIITEKTSRDESKEILNLLTNSTTSLQVNYGWDVNATSWLIREYLADAAPAKKVLFDNSYILQAYVFSDGSGNKFRFCVDDNYPNLSASNHEVSPWFTVDWLGWKLVSWDMTNDGTGTWIGDGTLDGTLRLESIQLTYNPGSPVVGTFYFDDLRIVQKVPVSVVQEERLMPDQFQLFQNSPNPFNSETLIKYQLIGYQNHVRLVIFDLLGKKVRTLVNETQDAGEYFASWDGTDDNNNYVASGTYICKLDAGKFHDSKRMVLVK